MWLYLIFLLGLEPGYQEVAINPPATDPNYYSPPPSRRVPPPPSPHWPWHIPQPYPADITLAPQAKPT